VQLLVIGFDQPGVHDGVLAELGRVDGNHAVRILDVLLVRKDAEGVVERADASDIGGTLVQRLVGLDADEAASSADDELWSLDDAIPNDSQALIVLVEHRWAIGTRDAIRAAGGTRVADAWVHPADLAALALKVTG
jgi:hypothetical protein